MTDQRQGPYAGTCENCGGALVHRENGTTHMYPSDDLLCDEPVLSPDTQ